MKKSALLALVLLVSIPCSLWAADGAPATKEGSKKDGVKKVSVGKKHGTSVKAKKHSKKNHSSAQSTAQTDKNNSETQKEKTK